MKVIQTKKCHCLVTWRKASKSIINVTEITIWFMDLFESCCSRSTTNTLAKREPEWLPIDTPLTCLYIVSLKLNETDLVANSINTINICPGNDGGLEWLRYKQSAQILIVSSKEMLVKKRGYIKWNKKLNIHSTGKLMYHRCKSEGIHNTRSGVKL